MCAVSECATATTRSALVVDIPHPAHLHLRPRPTPYEIARGKALVLTPLGYGSFVGAKSTNSRTASPMWPSQLIDSEVRR